MEEIWKPVVWYEWIYEVSNSGKLKSLKFWEVNIIKWHTTKYWYTHIGLTLNWIGNSTCLHRLVAIAFIANPLNLPYVCHIDETLDENWALYNWEDNLFWWTEKDNVHDMIKKWRAKYLFVTNHPNKWKFWKDNRKSKKVYQYSKDWEFIKTWSSVREITRSLWINNISACCLWKYKTAGWFIWEYKD